MRMLEEFFPEFTEKLEEIDKLYAEKRMIDEKTYQFICFALSIKARSKPCVLKHFKGALEAGATVKELSYIFALVMREAAGADDCWTHDVIGDWKEILKGNISCSCEKSNCGRPPHPKGWGMLRAARPVTRGQIIKHPL
ncbi:carboxymuconolactone decarboxylase family protein, partial [Methanosarcina mazei]